VCIELVKRKTPLHRRVQFAQMLGLVSSGIRWTDRPLSAREDSITTCGSPKSLAILASTCCQVIQNVLGNVVTRRFVALRPVPVDDAHVVSLEALVSPVILP
jgi:hypothetical protein